MDTLATLLLGHLIGDFPLQTDWVYKFKTRCSAGVAFHAAIHVVVTALLIQDPLRHWPLLCTLGLIHFATDWIKVRFPTRPQTPGFLIDQAVHLGAILLIARMAPNLTAVLPPSLLYPSVLIALLPALMVLLWIVACDKCQEAGNAGNLENWARHQMLSLSQRAGVVLLAGLTIERLIAL